jgi:UDP-N-acetyl-D-mannosaminuronic acid dehydrogenase
MNSRTVAVVGLGYIGLPTAAILASSGWKVIGIDINQHAVDTINDGRIHIVEPGLAEIVAEMVADGQFRATTVPEPADAFLIAVPTPFRNDHEPDLSYVEAASRAIAPHLKRGDIVILESTSPVGASEQMTGWLAEGRPDLRFPQHAADTDIDVHVAYCPERVLPGNVIEELISNDRVIGGMSPACSQAAAAVYRTFVKGECVITNARTAEMCKLTENSFRDVNIAFANELSMICDELSIDVWELIMLANRHPRVNILQPGPGVGGHCIAVDPWFIVHSSPRQAKLIRAAREINDAKPAWVLDKVKQAARQVREARNADGPVTVACLGLSFKANIDDLRESPAVAICEQLASTPGYRVLAVEPHITDLPKGLAGRVELLDADAAIEGADIVLLLVDHAQFRDLAGRDERAVAIDTRGAWRDRGVEPQLEVIAKAISGVVS